MQLQFFFRPDCIECLRVKVLLKRIKPDYPDLQVEAIDLTSQPKAAVQSGLVSAPSSLLDGELVARKHVKEAELRRLLRRDATGRQEQTTLPFDIHPLEGTENGSTPD